MIDVDPLLEDDRSFVRNEARSREHDFAVVFAADDSALRHVLESFKERFVVHDADEMLLKVQHLPMVAGDKRDNGTDH